MVPVAVVEYHGGNAPSVLHALAQLGVPGVLAACPAQIEAAERIILPGVGAAGATMDSLRAADLIGALERRVLRERAPFLGICIGLQILFEHSEEDDAKCLGWLRGRVRRFPAGKLRVPQIGWNEVNLAGAHPVCAGLPRAGHFYFVNSYYAEPHDPSIVLGSTPYGVDLPALIARGNLVAAQFHVEKSGPLGLRLLRNFVSWRC